MLVEAVVRVRSAGFTVYVDEHIGSPFLVVEDRTAGEARDIELPEVEL